MVKVFIDGSAGTTGLRIVQRLSQRPEIELLSIPEEYRKSVQKRAECINRADLAFLCLPDDAAREVVPLIDPAVKVLDTSTAHRTHADWVYGLPELHGARDRLRRTCRVAVPGCYATGFLALAAPLTELGLLPRDYPLACYGLSGYSGAGKSGIAQYTAADRDPALDSPRPYALGQQHKHLPEMQAVAGLAFPPAFCPVVDNYYSGMEVTIPLHAAALGHSAQALARALAEYYADEPVVTVHPFNEAPAFLPANAKAGLDSLDIYVTASADGQRMLLISLFDNLGKGSSGAAIQCMNLLLDLPETEGLAL